MENSLPPSAKLTVSLQRLADQIRVAQQSGRKDVVVDIKLASGAINEITKILLLNVELHQMYLENQAIAIELDGGNYIVTPESR
jgi:hypothetical protein